MESPLARLSLPQPRAEKLFHVEHFSEGSTRSGSHSELAATAAWLRSKVTEYCCGPRRAWKMFHVEHFSRNGGAAQTTGISKRRSSCQEHLTRSPHHFVWSGIAVGTKMFHVEHFRWNAAATSISPRGDAPRFSSCLPQSPFRRRAKKSASCVVKLWNCTAFPRKNVRPLRLTVAAPATHVLSCLVPSVTATKQEAKHGSSHRGHQPEGRSRQNDHRDQPRRLFRLAPGPNAPR